MVEIVKKRIVVDPKISFISQTFAENLCFIVLG